MEKEVSVEERKSIQLEMLEEIDSFCRLHQIRYIIAYGTLIGAIRHQGFIPWDDDVDIIMPLSDMLRFKEEFQSEKLQYCDVDTYKGHQFPFSRIAYKPTYSKTGKVSQSYGVNIDLYFTIGISDNDEKVDNFFKGANRLLKCRLLARKVNEILTRHLPIRSIPGYNKINRIYRDYYMRACVHDNPKRFFAVSGLPIWTEVYDFDLFANLIDVKFENLTLLAPAEYHRFLTQEYGDYMQLPPEEERHPYHGGRYFWKNNMTV